MLTRQREIFEQGAMPKEEQYGTTLGTVVDANDPQQMGRIRCICPQWGDSWSSNIEDLPWALYLSPFGGQVQVGTRGPGIQSSEGGVSYGMWAIPKVGSQVAVVCVDGNPMTRMYIGCVYDQFTPHTMPHGRFMYDDHPTLEKSGNDTKPYGPYTSTEKLIHPTAENLKRAFNVTNDPNPEYQSRGADYSVSRVDVSQLDVTYSQAQDDKGVKDGKWTATNGYQVSRTDPNADSTLTDANYDSQVYCMTTPGFHAFSMDDRQENCRVRLRTTSGHQIIMDDTNERIYIATAQGNNWIEMDQDGNIDIYTANKLNIHAAKEINMTSDESIRMHAKKGIHMHSDSDIRMTSGGTLHLKSASDINATTGAALNLMAAGNIVGQGAAVHFNGPVPGAAKPALFTNRVPAHEPWPRTMTKSDTSHAPEHAKDSDQVNRSERGRTINRGAFWRR